MTRHHIYSSIIEDIRQTDNAVPYYDMLAETSTTNDENSINLAKWFSDCMSVSGIEEHNAYGQAACWCRDSSISNYLIPPKTAVIVARYPLSWTTEDRAQRTPSQAFYVYPVEALERLEVCDECGRINVEGNCLTRMGHTHDGFTLCTTCLGHYAYAYCNKCGRYYDQTEGERIRLMQDDGSHCFAACVCPSCTNDVLENPDLFAYCNTHNAYYMRQGENVLGEVDSCPMCFRERLHDEASGVRVNGYHYRPRLHFSHPRSRFNRLHVGIEYEYSGLGHDEREEMLRAAYVLSKGKVYGQEDCTVSVEICTHPLTLDEHKPLAQTMERLARYYDATGHNAGCHMHLDIRYFGDTEQEQRLNRYKMALLFDKFSPQLLSRSQRDNTEYCQRSQTLQIIRNMGYSVPLETDSERLRVVERLCHGERYQTVNNRNSDTIEIRLPAQTCSAAYIIAWLTFLEDLSSWVRETDCETVEDIRWSTLLSALPCGDVLEGVV